jgi:WD40 repeat protein
MAAREWVALAFSPDEQYLAAYESGTDSIYLWRLPSLAPVWQVRAERPPQADEFSDGLVFTASGLTAINDYGATVYELKAGKTVSTINWETPASDSVLPFARVLCEPGLPLVGILRYREDANEKRLSDLLTVHDLRTGRAIRVLPYAYAKSTEASSDTKRTRYFHQRLASAEDGSWTALRNETGEVRAWRSEAAAAHVDLALPEDVTPSHVVVCPKNGAVAAALGADIRLWRTDEPDHSRLVYRHANGIAALASSRSGPKFASAGRDGLVAIWDAESGSEVCRSFQPDVRSLCFSADGGQLLCGMKNGEIRAIDTRAGIDHKQFRAHGSAVSALCVTADGHWLVSGGEDNQIRVWESLSAEPQEAARMEHRGAIQSLACSREGRLLVSIGGDDLMRIWDLKSGEARRSLRETAGEVRGITFGPDGERLITLVGESLRIRDLESGQVVLDFARLPAKGVCFDNAEGFMAVGHAAPGIRLWRL